jgi:hypothetical protein
MLGNSCDSIPPEKRRKRTVSSARAIKMRRRTRDGYAKVFVTLAPEKSIALGAHEI